MTADVMLIGESNIKLYELLDNFRTITGRKLSESSDQYPLPLTEPAKYLAAIHHISGYSPNTSPGEVLRNYFHITGVFLHYTFLVCCEEETLAFMKGYTRLSVVYTKTPEGKAIGVLAANLAEWQLALTYSCSKAQTTDFRMLCNKIILHFDKLGLSMIFGHWIKEDAGDGTFFLRGRK